MTTPRQPREAAIGQGSSGVLGGSFDLWDGTRISCNNATRRGLTRAQGRDRLCSFGDIQLTVGAYMRSGNLEPAGATVPAAVAVQAVALAAVRVGRRGLAGHAAEHEHVAGVVGLAVTPTVTWATAYRAGMTTEASLQVRSRSAAWCHTRLITATGLIESRTRCSDGGRSGSTCRGSSAECGEMSYLGCGQGKPGRGHGLILASVSAGGAGTGRTPTWSPPWMRCRRHRRSLPSPVTLINNLRVP